MGMIRRGQRANGSDQQPVGPVPLLQGGLYYLPRAVTQQQLRKPHLNTTRAYRYSHPVYVPLPIVLWLNRRQEGITDVPQSNTKDTPRPRYYGPYTVQQGHMVVYPVCRRLVIQAVPFPSLIRPIFPPRFTSNHARHGDMSHIALFKPSLKRAVVKPILQAREISEKARPIWSPWGSEPSPPAGRPVRWQSIPASIYIFLDGKPLAMSTVSSFLITSTLALYHVIPLYGRDSFSLCHSPGGP